MRVLILGGTRFLSKETVRQAVARGHEVVCAARGKGGEAPDDATFVRIDRDDDDGLSALDGHFDAVIDVGRIPSHIRHAVRDLGDRADHWTFVSTISVYADNATPGQSPASGTLLDPLADNVDDTDEKAEENYGHAKVSCENFVAKAVGDKAFVVRAGLIVGPEDPSDRYTYWVERLARGGRVLAPGSPDDLVQLVDVRDLAAWLLDGAERRLVGVFDGIGAPFPRRQLLAETAAGVGTSPDLTWLDQDFLQAHNVMPWAGPRSIPLWLPQPEYAGLLTHDAGPALGAGLSTRPLPETARDTLRWLRDTGHRTSSAGLTADEERELLAAADRAAET